MAEPGAVGVALNAEQFCAAALHTLVRSFRLPAPPIAATSQDAVRPPFGHADVQTPQASATPVDPRLLEVRPGPSPGRYLFFRFPVETDTNVTYTT